MTTYALVSVVGPTWGKSEWPILSDLISAEWHDCLEKLSKYDGDWNKELELSLAELFSRCGQSLWSDDDPSDPVDPATQFLDVRGAWATSAELPQLIGKKYIIQWRSRW